MTKIYGIKNCDTMKKAFTWLEQNNIDFEFINYKVAGITQNKIKEWLQSVDLTELINNKGTTYRRLSDEEKLLLQKKTTAIKLLVEKPTIMKRPVWELSNGKLYIGIKPMPEA